MLLAVEKEELRAEHEHKRTCECSERINDDDGEKQDVDESMSVKVIKDPRKWSGLMMMMRTRTIVWAGRSVCEPFQSAKH